jgi:flagellar basal body-associated protein FliL
VFAVLIGVGGLVVVFALVVLTSWKGTEGLAALGVISSPIAAIVGAFFGVHLSGRAAEASQQSAVTAARVAQTATATAQRTADDAQYRVEQAYQQAAEAERQVEQRLGAHQDRVRAELERAYRAPSTAQDPNEPDRTSELVAEAWRRATTV